MKAIVMVILGILVCIGHLRTVHYQVFKNKGPKCHKADCSHKHCEVVEEKLATMVLGHDEHMLTCTGCGNTKC